jgi:hypothetical protein
VEAGQGGKEVKKVSLLVGAEAERKLLVQLLNKKASLSSSQTNNKKLQSVLNQPLDSTDGSRLKVIGFGKRYAGIYGLGAEYDPTKEMIESNERFDTKVDQSRVPFVVRAKGVTSWTSDETGSKTDRKAVKINRHRSGYSGLS